MIDEVYELPTGGYDIPRRLGAERDGASREIHAADLLDEGDRLNAIAQILALLCVPIVVALDARSSDRAHLPAVPADPRRIR